MDKFLFAKRLREKRKEKNLTQRQLADYLRVNVATVNGWENAKQEPDGIKMQNMATWLGTSASYLEGRTDDPAPEPEEVFRMLDGPDVDKTKHDKMMVNVLLRLGEQSRAILDKAILAAYKYEQDHGTARRSCPYQVMMMWKELSEDDEKTAEEEPKDDK